MCIAIVVSRQLGVSDDFVDPERFVLKDFPEVLCVGRLTVADLDAESRMLGCHEMRRVPHTVVGNLKTNQ